MPKWTNSGGGGESAVSDSFHNVVFAIVNIHVSQGVTSLLKYFDLEIRVFVPEVGWLMFLPHAQVIFIPTRVCASYVDN